jgi:hypothetical protein
MACSVNGTVKAERRGGLAVHDHLEFCRKLDREIARLLTAQNAINVHEAVDLTYKISKLRGHHGRIDLHQKYLWRFCNTALRFEGLKIESLLA